MRSEPEYLENCFALAANKIYQIKKFHKRTAFMFDNPSGNIFMAIHYTLRKKLTDSKERKLLKTNRWKARSKLLKLKLH